MDTLAKLNHTISKVHQKKSLDSKAGCSRRGQESLNMQRGSEKGKNWESYNYDLLTAHNDSWVLSVKQATERDQLKVYRM